MQFLSGIPSFWLAAALILGFNSGAYAQSLVVGERLPDFTLPSALADYGQRLSEQRGRPLLLIFPGRCNDCAAALQPLQRLQAGFALQHLTSWVIWTPANNDRPPQLHIPVLQRPASDWPHPLASIRTPAVLLINPDGVLAHHISGRLRELADLTQPVLTQWLDGLTTAGPDA